MSNESDIKVLLKAMSEIEAAFKSGNSFLYGQLGEKYGPLACRVYKKLDAPSKSTERDFFDKTNKPIALDPWTTINRIQSLTDNGRRDITPYSPVFWCHSDLIKSLVDYILLTHSSEVSHACA